MAEEPKERKAFEAHMRVGGYSNHDKHLDGSYVSSAMELWWQGWKARAQLPSQGGEAVEVFAYGSSEGYQPVLPRQSIGSNGERMPYYDIPLMTVAQHNRIMSDVRANRDAVLKVMQARKLLPKESRNEAMQG